MHRRKILLLNLPNYCAVRRFYSLPLGLAYLAASLDDHNTVLKGLDLAATKEKNGTCYLNSPKKYIDEIARFNPDYVLIGCLVHNRFNVFYWSKLIKKHVKGVKIIIGNYFASTKPREILENVPWVDYIVLGEGDKTIGELIKGIENKDLNGVKNICFRGPDGDVIIRRTNAVLNLDTLPFPKRGIFNKDEYVCNIGGKSFLNLAPISSSRGCPMRCTYCTNRIFEGIVYRARSADDILKEIEALKKEGYSNFIFIDDTFTVNKKRILEFCNKVIEKKLDIRWICWSCLNINLDALDFMKKAGCVLISFGLESVNPEILRRFKKNMDINHAKKLIIKCKKAGIDARLTLLVNSGYETRESLRETFNFLKQLKIRGDKIDYSEKVWILPGSDLEKEIFSKKREAFDWFKPKNDNFIVEKDNAGNHLVPLFKGIDDKEVPKILEEYGYRSLWNA